MPKSLKSRSWLIVEPSAEPAAVQSAGADRILLDLTGSSVSWQAVSEFSKAWSDMEPDQPLSFLLPPFLSGRTETAAGNAVRAGAVSVFLSGARSGAEVQRLDVILRVEEIRGGDAPGGTAIVALANAAGMLAAASFERCSRRLRGIGWEAQGGPLSDTARLARATIRLAASAAGVVALDAVSPTGDDAAFRSECLAARENGFAGKLSRQSRQIPIINHVFADQASAPVGRTISKTSEPPSA
ncbi:citrate lyase subunit beta / citryl-CoA lyase [Xaviernesmea oryzae]|uniref:Citrate lyase subunit beta / citryl-CoA lyase n=1 Tax=Xaviernesmea oryzae TaxID=464029 RepID=A0A1X7GGW6_9HYPH|nr:hypothetical protein [Xaviernesmea oryzae]SMF69529.1 citrate lyase subunit beta / citryl-CoA lyase [Xaviernesmea oryzae]